MTRPGHDRRLRLARLSRRVAARARREDQGARDLEGHDDDLDLRPPRDPGGGVGLVPAPDRGAAPGRGRLLRVGRPRPRRSSERPRHQRPPGLGLGAAAPAPRRAGGRARARAASRAPSCSRRCRPPPRCSRPTGPTGTSPRGSTRSGPSRRATPRSSRRTLNLTPELMSQIPAEILRIGVEGETLLEALPRMREAYCGHDRLPDRAPLLAPAADVAAGDDRDRLAPQAASTTEEKQALLDRLIQVFGFERYVEKAYLGQKMFSIEGLDAVVPMLDEIFEMAHTEGAREVVIGMAHRGRLSVLAHNLGRPPQSILAEFEGAKAIEAVKAVAAIPTGGTGDVKYHYGHGGRYTTRDGEEIEVRLYPNPSHLEFVDPVVTGAARADQTSCGRAEPRARPVAASCRSCSTATRPSRPRAWSPRPSTCSRWPATAPAARSTSSRTTRSASRPSPEEARSTPYAADMAKGFNVPIIHVNADDPEACVAAVRLAMAYRERWGRDVVIDLIGYRRFGHNETDEPAYTQPLMAAKIKEHPPVSQLYAEKLVATASSPPRRSRAERGAPARAEGRARRAAREDRVRRARGPDGHRHRRARPHPQPERGHRRPGGAAPRAERGAAARAGQLHHPPQAPQAARQAARGDGRGRDRVRPRRVARPTPRCSTDGVHVRLTGPGHRARHLLPSPPRPPRREDRPALRADPEPARGQGAVRAAQQPALRDRLPRLRVRLLGGLARQPDPLGGPVRRLRQLGAGDHRQLHRRPPRPSGARCRG